MEKSKSRPLSSEDQATVRHRISGKPLVTTPLRPGRMHTTITALQQIDNPLRLAIVGE
jgi:hypothetical protein